MSTRDTVADVLQDALPMAPATAPRIDRATYERLARVAVKEGLEAWRGEGCCVGSPLDGVGFVDDGCSDDCCARYSPQKDVVRRLIDDVMNAQRLDVADELSSCLVWQVEGLSR